MLVLWEKAYYFVANFFQVHFVEMDPWVVSDVLRPNLEWTGFLDNSVIHTVRVETFFERIKESSGNACRAFFIIYLFIYKI